MALHDRRDWLQAIALHEYDLVKTYLIRFAGTANGMGETGLMLAARLNDVEMIKILCIQEATLVNKEGYTALMIAACCDNLDACRILIPFEKGVFLPDGRTPLMLAVEAGSIDCVRLLLNYYGMERDNHNLTALDYAVRSDRPHFAQLINSANNITDENYASAMASVSRSSSGMREVLNASRSRGVEECPTCHTPVNCIHMENQGVSSMPPALLKEDQDLRMVFENGASLSPAGGRTLSWHEQIVVDVRNLRKQYNKVVRENLEMRNVMDELSTTLENLKENNAQLTSDRDILKETNKHLSDMDRRLKQVINHTGEGDVVDCVNELVNTMREQVKAREEDLRNVSNALDQVISESRVMSSEASDLKKDRARLLSDVKDLRQKLYDKERELRELEIKLETSNREAEQLVYERQEVEETLTRLTNELQSAKTLLQTIKQGAASIEGPARISDIDSRGFTPLLRAIADGDCDGVRELLGLPLPTQDIYDDNVSMIKGGNTKHLNLTLVPKHLDISKMLNERDGLAGSNGATTGHRTELISAVLNNDIHSVWQLIPQRAGEQDMDGRTAMMYAAQKGYTEMVRLLVDKEARIQTPYGTTALMDAACNGHTNVVRLLCDREGGMCTNAKHTVGAGLTALMLAAHEGHVECVRLLADKELSMRCANGKNAIDYARTEEIKRILSNWGM